MLYSGGFAYDSTITFPVPVAGLKDLTCRHPTHYPRPRIEILQNTLATRKEIHKEKSSIPALSYVPFQLSPTPHRRHNLEWVVLRLHS